MFYIMRSSFPPSLIFTCTLLLACQVLFFAALAAVQRKSQQHRYNQRLAQYRKTGLDPDKVPKRLQELIPLARKWEAQDSLERQHLQRTTTLADKLELSQQMVGHEDFILDWLSLFKGHALSREAAAYAAMLLSFQEMQLIVDDRYLADNEAVEVAFARHSPAPARLPRAARYRPRFLKNLPLWAYFVIYILLYSGNFIMGGKLWAFLFPHDASTTGLAIVGFLSALIASITATLVDRWYGFLKA